MKIIPWQTLSEEMMISVSVKPLKAEQVWLARAEFNTQSGELCRVTLIEKADDAGQVTFQDVDEKIGCDPVETESTVSFLAKLTVNKGVPFSRNAADRKKLSYMLVCQPQGALIGTYLENWRVKTPYLPCPLGTVAGKQWRNGIGEARINTQTQAVESLSFYDEPSDGFVEGCIVQSEPGFIVVTCVMANGGVCFGSAIR